MEELYDIFQPQSRGYRITEKIRKCSDGTEYEITEIRGPKASGFFFAENYGL